MTGGSPVAMTLEERADQMAVTLGRLLSGHRVVLQGIGTPLAMAAIAVAKRLHAPDLQIMYSVGNVLSELVQPARICGAEWATVPGALQRLRLSEVIWQSAPSFRAAELIRPAQMDAEGNTNNAVIGSYEKPKVRLPGAAGIPDAQVFNPNLIFYLPHHDRRTLVARPDFVSGSGAAGDQREVVAGNEPRTRMIVTGRGVLSLRSGVARLVSLHRGEEVEEVCRQTGFALVGSPTETEPPTPEELAVLEELDPMRARDTEMLEGATRRARLRELVEEEVQRFGAPGIWRRSERWELVAR